MLTTHRLMWIDAAAAPSAGASCSLPLSAVRQLFLKGRILATPKIHVHVHTSYDGRVVAGTLSQACWHLHKEH